MPIPDICKDKKLYHFTHIKNVEQIILGGKLLAKNQIGCSHNIAYSDIQDRRANLSVPVGPKGVVHDYVPFYFCSRTPMLLAVISNKIAEQRDIVYFEFPIELLDMEEAVFTYRSANSSINPAFFSNPENLEKLDWESIETWKWGKQYDEPGKIPIKQRKMAEALLLKQVSLKYLERIVVWDTSRQEYIQRLYGKRGEPYPNIISNYPYNKNYYYSSFSCFGPFDLLSTFRTKVSLLFSSPKKGSYQFKTLSDVLVALNKDFSCIQCTRECVGLQSANDLHDENVDEHILSTVKQLKILPEYKKLNASGQKLIELAAFFHDVGKGPKSRWSDGVQKADPDHPLRSLEMTINFLENCVEQWSQYEAAILCKLVCYHDLVGMIMNAGRQLTELVNVADSLYELDLLIMLSKADTYSVSSLWWDDDKAENIKRAVHTAWGY